jgi:hypothetical protein
VRSSSAVLLAVLCGLAYGQHRGGAVGVGGGSHPGASPPVMNSFVNPSLRPDLTFAQRLGATVSGSWAGVPSFWGWAAPGQGPFPGWSGAPGFGGPGFSRRAMPFWNGAQSFGATGSYPLPYPVYGAGSYAPDYYPPQPFNVIMPPLQDVAESTPSVSIREPRSGIRTVRPSSEPVGTQETMGRGFGPDAEDTSSADRSTVHVYQAPGREPAPQVDHPPLIALKNGWAYTATRYWVKGNTLHFVTTLGRHIQVPLSLLDRLYEGEKVQGAESKLPPARR